MDFPVVFFLGMMVLPSIALPPIAPVTKISFPCKYVILSENETLDFEVPVIVENVLRPLVLKLVITHSENAVWTFDVPPTPYYSEHLFVSPEPLNPPKLICGSLATHKFSINGVVERLTRMPTHWSFVQPGTYLVRALLFEKDILANGSETLIHVGDLPSEWVIGHAKQNREERKKQFADDALDVDLRKAFESGYYGNVIDHLKKESGIFPLYSFQLFNKNFTKLLLEEVRHFEEVSREKGLKITRPNTMNNYGAVLSEMGLTDYIDSLSKEVILPIARMVFPSWPVDQFDSHHAFVVDYQIGKDEELDYHMDESLVTLNICLGEEFVGGDVYFNGIRGSGIAERAEMVEVSHSVGKAIMHVGQHCHGARKISSGRRTNLIIWFRNSEFYQSPTERLLKILSQPPSESHHEL